MRMSTILSIPLHSVFPANTNTKTDSYIDTGTDVDADADPNADADAGWGWGWVSVLPILSKQEVLTV